jgi:hypothetical protein
MSPIGGQKETKIKDVPPVSVPRCGVSATTALQKAGVFRSKLLISGWMDELILLYLPSHERKDRTNEQTIPFGLFMHEPIRVRRP